MSKKQKKNLFPDHELLEILIFALVSYERTKKE